MIHAAHSMFSIHNDFAVLGIGFTFRVLIATGLDELIEIWHDNRTHANSVNWNFVVTSTENKKV